MDLTIEEIRDQYAGYSCSDLVAERKKLSRQLDDEKKSFSVLKSNIDQKKLRVAVLNEMLEDENMMDDFMGDTL